MYYIKQVINYDLINDLMESKQNQEKIVTNSHLRENLIVQTLMNHLELSCNPDTSFINGREIIFIVISFYKKNNDNKFNDPYSEYILNQNASEFTFTVPENIAKDIKYNITIKKQTVNISRNVTGTKDEKCISISSDKCCFIGKDNSITSTKTYSAHEQKFYPLNREYDDNLGNKLTLVRKRNEFDGNLIAKRDINNLQEIFKDMIYYPKNDNIKIEKNEVILVEVKQNDTVKDLFDQMKEKIDRLKYLFPKRKFEYFGFLNEDRYKINMSGEEEEKKFIADIDEYLSKNPNFRIFIFLIKGQKFLDISLQEDQIDYPTFYNFQMNKKFDLLENEIKLMKNDINNLKDQVNEIGKKMDLLIEGINNKKTESAKAVNAENNK